MNTAIVRNGLRAAWVSGAQVINGLKRSGTRKHPRPFAALGLLAAFLLSTIHAFALPPGDWVNTFTDDFNGSSLNTSVWSTGYRWAAIINDEWQGFRPENVIVANGVCTLKVEARDCANQCMTGYEYGNQPYASGAIQTYNKWTQQYGYFEARLKLPTAIGTWPAFWLLPDRGASVANLDRRVEVSLDNGYGIGNEIDIFEIMGTWDNNAQNLGQSHSGYFWNYSGGSRGDYSRVNGNGDLYWFSNPSTAYHTFGVYWEPGRLIYYIDDVMVDEYRDDATISTSPQYMILNVSVHPNDWKGTTITQSLVDAALPDAMVIDYVKVYSGTIAAPDDAITSLPSQSYVPMGATNTTVAVGYDASTRRDIVVCLKDMASGEILGEGREMVYSGSGSVSVPVTLEATASSGSHYRYIAYVVPEGEAVAEAVASAESGPVSITAPLVVVNNGFELGNLNGWSVINSGGYGSGCSVANNINDQNNTYPTFSNPLPGTASGTYYASVRGYDGYGRQALYQNISANGQGNGSLLPNTTYILTMAMGVGRYDFNINNATVALINGTSPSTGTVLATATVSSLGFSPYANNFKDLAVWFTTGSSVSGDLTIAIWTTYGYPSRGSIRVDNVRLDRAPLPDTTPPTVPQNLVATTVSTSQIDLSWSASTDDAGVCGYDVMCNSEFLGVTTSTSYSDTGLSADTTYTYTIAAFDAMDNTSADSVSASATTASEGGGTPSLVVLNSGFESGNLNGWSVINSGGYGSGCSVANNVNDQNNTYPTFSNPLPGTASGTYYATVRGYNGYGPQYLYQNVSANGQGNGPLQPNTTYTLTVAMGVGRYDYSVNNATIALINGTSPTTGTVLATATVSSLGFGSYANNFKDLIVTYTTGSSVSGDLTIAIWTPYGYSAYNSIKVDNVQLDVEPDPTPIIVNSEFESGNLNGWSVINSGGYGSGCSVVNNVNDQNNPYPTFSNPLPGTALGANYAWVRGYNGYGPQYLYQNVSANGQGNAPLRPNTTYTLTVAMGVGRYDYNVNNATIALINGTSPTTGTVLATANVSILGFSAYANNFKNLIVTYTTGSYVSGDLTIAIWTPYGYSAYNSIKVDNVRLDVE